MDTEFRSDYRSEIGMMRDLTHLLVSLDGSANEQVARVLLKTKANDLAKAPIGSAENIPTALKSNLHFLR